MRLLLKSFAPDYLVSFIDKNIIYSIRTMFLNALNMMIAPVIFFSIVAGLTSMANASDISRIGGKLLLIHLCTTLIATVFSMTLSIILFHSGIPQVGTVTAAAGEGVSISLVDMIVGIIPKDLITPIVKRDMLQIIFMAFIFGTTINILGEKVSVLSRIADVMNTLNLRIIAIIARFIPIVAFCP